MKKAYELPPAVLRHLGSDYPLFLSNSNPELLVQRFCGRSIPVFTSGSEA